LNTAPEKTTRTPGRHDKPLPFWPRVLLLAAGWVLFVVGIAGLILPGIQGVLTLLVAAALLSAGSATAHRWIRSRFRRWPKGWKRIEKFRRRLRRWFHRDPDEPRP
jgi:uncharacterized membrane protein YbaN (DUF454 family)